MSQKPDMQNKYLLNTAQQTSEKIIIATGFLLQWLNEGIRTNHASKPGPILTLGKKDTIFKITTVFL